MEFGGAYQISNFVGGAPPGALGVTVTEKKAAPTVARDPGSNVRCT